MSKSPVIICRPTKWFLWRAILMLIMFGGFGAYFLYDWKIGYPEKNYVIAHYKAFAAAGEAWSSEEIPKDDESWSRFVESQTIPFEEDRAMYPADTDFDKKWPDLLKEMDDHKSGELWREYSKEKGWPQKIDLKEDPKPTRKIKEQLIAALVCFTLTAITLFFLFRTKSRSMKADERGYYPPGGEFIPYDAMKSIDKRKWETKGLARLTYEKDGEEKTTKIDGMVYGQFKEEDGAPAEALFQKILENFDGELIELVMEDEEETEDPGSDRDEAKNRDQE